MKRKILLRIAFLLVLLITVINGTALYFRLLDYRSGEESYQQIREETAAVEKEKIDIPALQAVNPDFRGWLTLEGTVIDYPVVKGQDNVYYLDHLFDRSSNILGCLFIDARNQEPFLDKVTVIYGHDVQDGSMFTVLEDYKEQSFYEEHRSFRFVSEQGDFLLEPFAGEVRNAEVPFVQTQFQSAEEYADYLKSFIERSTFVSDVPLTSDDKVVMMIKCSRDYTNARYVLLCKVSRAS